MINIEFDFKKIRKELGKLEDKLVKDINKQFKKQPSDKFIRKHFKFKNSKELDADITEKNCKDLDEYLKKHSKFKNKDALIDRIFKEEIKL